MRRLERVWSRSHSSDDLKNFRSATNLYHTAIIKADNSSLISHWTNFLILNPSKTEFLVIGLPQQLYKRNIPLFIYITMSLLHLLTLLATLLSSFIKVFILLSPNTFLRYGNPDSSIFTI
jgi:hypothetical protein